MAFDRTLVAVKRQLKAFNCNRFELGLFNREQGKMIPRTWDGDEVIKAVPWLKVMNAKGHDIFIRPEGSTGLVFFDDLTMGVIQRLEDDGLTPAVIIESSPLNYHGWIRVSNSPIPSDLATAVCKVLASQYDGDTDSADWRHYGRLAGFTNRKVKYIDENGRLPFVLLSSGKGKLAENSQQLLKLGQEELTRRKAELEKRRELITARAHVNGLKDGDEFYQSELGGLYRRYGANLDHSRADWMIVNKMISLGYSEASIYETLFSCSPALDTRQGHHEHYITTTINNAFGRGNGNV